MVGVVTHPLFYIYWDQIGDPVYDSLILRMVGAEIRLDESLFVRLRLAIQLVVSLGREMPLRVVGMDEPTQIAISKESEPTHWPD